MRLYNAVRAGGIDLDKSCSGLVFTKTDLFWTKITVLYQRKVCLVCPERQWRPHPWKHSVSGWTGFWATWSGCRCLCSLQGGWARWPLKVPSNPKHSMILWFY